MDIKPEGKAVSIAFISENKLRFSKSALQDIFEKVGTRPVSVVSINGPTKKEKSLILNEFIKFLSNYGDKNWFNEKNDVDFQWENSGNRQTPGISMWSQPIFIKKSGEEVAVLFMDTQGCFDEKFSTPQDLLILALSFVLSSNMVYCVPEKLSEDLLQFLQLFVGYSNGSIDLGTTENFFNLIFMIREWQFPGYYECGYHDSSAYPGKKSILHDILRVYKGETGECQFNHQIALASFKKIACCVLPNEDPEAYDVNRNPPPSFDTTVREMVPRILHPSNIFIKRFGDHKFKGHELARLFDQLDILFSNNEITQVENVLEYTAEVHYLVTLLNGFNYFRWEMDNILSDNSNLSEEQLKKLHDEQKEKILRLFTSKIPVNFERIGTRYLNLLQEMIENSYNFYLQVNGVKLDFLKIKYPTQQIKDEMEIRIRELNESFPNILEELDSDFRKIIGFDLKGLTVAVRSVFGCKVKNGH